MIAVTAAVMENVSKASVKTALPVLMIVVSAAATTCVKECLVKRPVCVPRIVANSVVMPAATEKKRVIPVHRIAVIVAGMGNAFSSMVRPVIPARMIVVTVAVTNSVKPN